MRGQMCRSHLEGMPAMTCATWHSSDGLDASHETFKNVAPLLGVSQLTTSCVCHRRSPGLSVSYCCHRSGKKHICKFPALIFSSLHCFSCDIYGSLNPKGSLMAQRRRGTSTKPDPRVCSAISWQLRCTAPARCARQEQ